MPPLAPNIGHWVRLLDTMISRAKHFRLIALAALLLPLLVACGRSENTLNLVLICIDTVRYDSFIEPGVTDALDPWFARAQVYDNAMSAAPWTIPSVATVLTGLYPAEHGAGRFEGDIADLSRKPPSPLADDRDTLAEVLRDEGIQTGAFVSHPFFGEALGLEQGFEVLRQRKGWEQDVEQFWRWKDTLDPDQRFFAYLHFMEAHDFHLKNRAVLSERLAALDEPSREAVRARANPALCSDSETLRCLRHETYNATVLQLRDALASLLQELERRHLLGRTVVVVYSDHGEAFWEHAAEEKAAGEDPRGWFGFGHGQSMYQELLHVPLVAWHPGWPGRRYPGLVSLVDVMPTLLNWLGAGSVPDGASGQLLPTPERRNSPQADRAVFASGIAYGPEKIAARTGDLKSIYTPREQRFEYFDLAADPGEHSPVTGNALTMQFDTLTGDYQERYRDSKATAGSYSPQQLESLQAIGYLQGASPDPGKETETATSPPTGFNPDQEDKHP